MFKKDIKEVINKLIRTTSSFYLIAICSLIFTILDFFYFDNFTRYFYITLFEQYNVKGVLRRSYEIQK